MLMVYSVISVTILAMLYKCIFGCKHNWSLYEEVEMESMYTNKRLDVYTIYRCSHCSAPKVDVSERVVNG